MPERASASIRAAPCASPSWERPDFAVPTLDALIAAGHEVVAVYSQPPRPAGRGKALRPSPVQQRAEAAGIEVRTPASLQGRGRAGGVRRARPRCRGGRGLRADPARADPRRAAPRLPQRPRLAAAALARRGADPARDPRRRRARPASPSCRWSKGSTPGRCWPRWPTEIDRKTAGELTAELAGIGAALMVEVLEQLAEIGPRAAARGAAPPTRPRSGSRRRGSISAEPADRGRAAGPRLQSRARAPGSNMKASGSSCSPPRSRTLSGDAGHGARPRPRHRLRRGRDRADPGPARRAAAPMTPAELLRGFAIPGGHEARMTRFRLTVEYDGRPVHGLAAPGARPLGPAGDRGSDRGDHRTRR